MAEQAELEFLIRLKDEATQALHGLEGVLKDVTGPLPDITGVIDITADGATTAAAAASKAAEGIPEDFAAAGQKSGERLRDEFGRFLPAIKEETERTGEESGEGLDEGVERGMGNGKAALLAGVAALAVAAGAVFAEAIGQAMEAEDLNAHLTGQLNLTGAESAKFGKIAGGLYSSNYGESLEEVNGAISNVVSAIGGIRTASEADISAATANAPNFASTFDVDVADAATSAGILIKTGLAADATAAFDLMVTAAQEAGPQMTEPLLEASNEYAQYFDTLGYTGEQAFATLVDATKNGEIALDKAGDAVKEFTIRSTDMSTSSVAAYQSLGLNADEMANKILAGGDTAQQATSQIVDGLRGITDPATQANTAIALFGTPLEDIGVDKVPLFLDAMQNASGELEHVSGRADALNATLGGTTTATLESVKRQFQQTFTQELGGVALPILSKAIGLASDYIGPLTAVAGVLGAVALVVGAVSAATAVWSTVQTVAKVATASWTAIQWLLNAALTANPIGLVILAIGALVAGIVLAYKNSETFREIVQAAMRGVVVAFGWVVDKAQEVWNWIKTFATKFVSVGADIVAGMKQGILDKAKELIGAVKDVAGKALNAAKDFLGIHSPSRVFRDQVGAMMGEGWAGGLEAAGAEVVATAEQIAADAAAAAAGDGLMFGAGGGPGPVSLGAAATTTAAGQAPSVTVAGYEGPSELVIVDEEGFISGKLRVVARDEIGQARQDDLVSARQNGRGR